MWKRCQVAKGNDLDARMLSFLSSLIRASGCSTRGEGTAECVEEEGVWQLGWVVWVWGGCSRGHLKTPVTGDKQQTNTMEY